MIFWMMFVKQASFLYKQFIQNEVMKNFNSTIHAVETVMKVISLNHFDLTDLVICLCDFDMFLDIWFENTKVMNDFNHMIDIIQKAISLDHSHSFICLVNLAICLDMQFDQTEMMNDLESTLNTIKITVQIIFFDYFSHVKFLSILENNLYRQFK